MNKEEIIKFMAGKMEDSARMRELIKDRERVMAALVKVDVKFSETRATELRSRLQEIETELEGLIT